VKRILVLLTIAALFAVVMAISAVTAVADPDCTDPKHADHPNCVETTSTSAPGGSENSQGKAAEHNPNFTTTTDTTFQPPGRR
jgi:hypothetical protein